MTRETFPDESLHEDLTGAEGRAHVTVEARFDPACGTVDLEIEVPHEESLCHERGFECYFQLYVVELRSPRLAWLPRAPLTYPRETSLRTPFQKRFRGLPCRREFFGVQVSVCSALHEEVDRVCRIYSVQDGRLVHEETAACPFGRPARRTG